MHCFHSFHQEWTGSNFLGMTIQLQHLTAVKDDQSKLPVELKVIEISAVTLEEGAGGGGMGRTVAGLVLDVMAGVLLVVVP